MSCASVGVAGRVPVLRRGRTQTAQCSSSHGRSDAPTPQHTHQAPHTPGSRACLNAPREVVQVVHVVARGGVGGRAPRRPVGAQALRGRGVALVCAGAALQLQDVALRSARRVCACLCVCARVCVCVKVCVQYLRDQIVRSKIIN